MIHWRKKIQKIWLTLMFLFLICWRKLHFICLVYSSVHDCHPQTQKSIFSFIKNDSVFFNLLYLTSTEAVALYFLSSEKKNFLLMILETSLVSIYEESSTNSVIEIGIYVFLECISVFSSLHISSWFSRRIYFIHNTVDWIEWCTSRVIKKITIGSIRESTG